MRILGVLYVGLLVIAAFVPFQFLPYGSGRPPGLGWNLEEYAIVRRPETWAVENRAYSRTISEVFREAPECTLFVEFEKDPAPPTGPGRILSYSRDLSDESISLEQSGDDLVFRLRGKRRCNLFMRGVLAGASRVRFVAALGPETRKVFVNGFEFSPPPPGSGSQGFTPENVLVLGDDVTGGRAWSGELYRLELFDQVLDPAALERLRVGRSAESGVAPILAAAFPEGHRAAARTGQLDDGFAPVRYQLPVLALRFWHFQPVDAVVNIAGFVPMAFAVYAALPLVLRRRKALSVVILPIAIGLLVSLAIEVTQLRLAGRDPNLLDLLYNGIGACAGSALLATGFIGRHLRTRRNARRLEERV